MSFQEALGCPTGIEPVSSEPQPDVLPLNYGHHHNFLKHDYYINFF